MGALADGTALTVDLLGGLPRSTQPVAAGRGPGRRTSRHPRRAPRPGAGRHGRRAVRGAGTADRPPRVGNQHLREAAAELCRVPGRYRDLVTHVAGLDEAARLLGRLATDPGRTWEGRRLVKLAVRITPPVPPLILTAPSTTEN
ncbi:hypothetical protein NKH77_38860 [Streptomyces sp. M19]